MAQQLSADTWTARFRSLPKSELHLHLEGALEPATVVVLAGKYGDAITEDAVAARYAARDFAAFIEAYKWVTSYLRAPEDYALAARRMCEQLLSQNVVYAEVTLRYDSKEQSFAALDHTYFDFRTPAYIALFNRARLSLRGRLGR